MKKLSLGCLAAATVLVTGCPHNEYIVELKPHGNGVERKLTFYRADFNDAGEVVKYEAFPTNELSEISAVYPTGV